MGSGALERFLLLARLPALPSLDEKCRALARAACELLACERVTAIVFGEDDVRYAAAPDGDGFTLREGGRGLQRLLLPALARFTVPCGFYVPADAVGALAGVTTYKPRYGLTVIPLETVDVAVGALVFDTAEQPAEAAMRELRVFADIAAWMIAHERDVSAAEREAKQSALLATINERARRSLDRESILESVVEDVRAAFGAMRCAVYARDAAGNEARTVACSETAAAAEALPARIPLESGWLERVFAGSTVGREDVCDDPRDAFLRGLGVGSALIVPLTVEGHVVYALALHFAAARAFDEIDMVMLRSVASHVGLALANVQLYDLERLRRARAESLERVVRMLRDTQTIEEVLLVFAVTVSHEVKITCAAYELEGTLATRRALRSVESARTGAPQQFDAGPGFSLIEREGVVVSNALPERLRRQIFGDNEGALCALRIDGNLWGLALFIAHKDGYDWNDSERRVYFRMLSSHLELALGGALGFERIQQLARALSESNEFKDDLLAMLAHDFKGPLTVILGHCELLQETAPAELRDELQTIHSQTKRLVRLSDDAVALAQTQAGGFSLEREALDLRGIVGESVRAHNRGESRINLDMPGEPVYVLLDAPRFNHVLDNLLMNALKYSHDEIDVRVTRGESNATIAVSDCGIGIPPAELGTVFARFGRASNARRKGISGSGVGLYVSRKIVEVHGGSIAVTSTEGQGSTFTVTLPLAQEQLERPGNGIG